MSANAPLNKDNLKIVVGYSVAKASERGHKYRPGFVAAAVEAAASRESFTAQMDAIDEVGAVYRIRGKQRRRGFFGFFRSLKGWLVPTVLRGQAHWCGKFLIISAPPKLSRY